MSSDDKTPIGTPNPPKTPNVSNRVTPTSRPVVEEAKQSKWFVVLIFAVAIGLASSFYISITNEYVPVNKRVIYKNGTDIEAIILLDDNLNVPIQTYLNHKTTTISAALYFKNIPTYVKDVKLSSVSKSILTVNNGTMKLDYKGKKPTFSNATALNYNGTIELGHPLQVRNFSEPYTIDIYYRTKTDTGPLKSQQIPFTWSTNTLDFGEPSYFWIIFLGVILSRVFTFSQDSSSGNISKVTTHLGSAELLWVPFSAIITLLIFSSFKTQVHLSTDIMVNIALAFGFGFGFDKVFEVWAKSPKRGEETPTKPQPS